MANRQDDSHDDHEEDWDDWLDKDRYEPDVYEPTPQSGDGTQDDSHDDDLLEALGEHGNQDSVLPKVLGQFAKDLRQTPSSIDDADTAEIPIICHIDPRPQREIDDDHDEDLWSELTKDEVNPLPKFSELLPLPLRLSDRNYQLGVMIGHATNKIGRGKFEVGGFFTIDADDPTFTLSDFIIPKGLPVERGSIYIAEHYPNTNDELQSLNAANKTKRRISALFHIHPTTKRRGFFHSGDDNRSLESMLNKTSVTNVIASSAPLSLINSRIRADSTDLRRIVRGNDLFDVIKEYGYPDDATFRAVLQEYGLDPPEGFSKPEFLDRLLGTIDETTEEPRVLRFSTSWVFENSPMIPYIKMRVDEQFVFSGVSNSYTITNPEIEIVDEGINIPTMAEVEKLVRERVKFPEPPKKPKAYKGPTGQYVQHGGYTVVQNTGYGVHGNWQQPIRQPVQPVKEEKELPKKVKRNKLTLQEQIYTFATQVFSYVHQYRDQDCHYSGFIDELVFEACKFRQRNQNHIYEEGSIRGTVLHDLKLRKDEDPPWAPDMSAYQIKTLYDRVHNFHSKNEDPGTLQFMNDFSYAPDLPSRNTVIESYVAKVLEDQKDESRTALGSAVIKLLRSFRKSDKKE